MIESKARNDASKVKKAARAPDIDRPTCSAKRFVSLFTSFHGPFNLTHPTMPTKKFASVNRKLSLVAIAVAGAFSGSLVSAQQVLGPYVGGNIGQTKADFSSNSINNRLIGQGLTINSRTFDNRDTGYKLFGGYQFHPNLAVEAGYFDLGSFSYGFNTTPLGSFSGNTKVKGLNLDLVGTLPISDRFSVFGRAGAAYAQTRSNFINTGAVAFNNSSTRNNDTNLKIGIGLQYAITEALSLRAELERYRINDPVRNRGYVDMASLGLIYRFGAKAPTPVAYVPIAAPAPAPVYVAPPAPAPAPMVAAPAPAPMPAPAPAPVFEAPTPRAAKLGRY